MKKFAVIDVGSNSVRLISVADGNVLYKTLNTTRLGEGLADKPVLKPAAIARTAEAVAEFCFRAKNEGAEEVFAFATAAVRSAENGKEFTEEVKRRCGIDVEVVSGEEEAELGLLGALGNADGAVIDVGGASTELVVKRDGKTVYKKSVDLGVVRIKDRWGRNKAEIESGSRLFCKAFADYPKTDRVCGIGGTATTLAALALGLREYDPKKVTGAVITAEELSEMAERLSEMPVEEIEKYPCMPKGRADVLSGGAVWLATVMKELGIEEMVVSDRDNLEGYAIKRGLME